MSPQARFQLSVCLSACFLCMFSLASPTPLAVELGDDVVNSKTTPGAHVEHIPLQRDECNDQPWCVRVGFRNTHSKLSLSLLSYRTPLDGVKAPGLFEVFDTTDGTDRPVQYIGMLAKRLPASDKDLLTLKPQQQLHSRVDLSQGYRFLAGHTYKVRVSSDALEHKHGKAFPGAVASPWHFMSVTTSSVEPWLQTRRNVHGHALESERVTSSLRKGGKRFQLSFNAVGCSNTNLYPGGKSGIATVLAAARVGTDEALVNYVDRNCAGVDYTEYFGSRTSTRFSTVKTTLTNVRSMIDGDSFGVVCGDSQCGSGVFAFVYPSDSAHNIYVCSAYWSAPNTLQYNSKPGTMVHEASHFNDIGDTNDFAYGQSGCRSLATSNPTNAVRNADSYEYFVEFVPGPGCCFGNISSTCGQETNCHYCTSNSVCTPGTSSGPFGQCVSAAAGGSPPTPPDDGGSSGSETGLAAGVSVSTIVVIVLVVAIIIYYNRRRRASNSRATNAYQHQQVRGAAPVPVAQPVAYGGSAPPAYGAPAYGQAGGQTGYGAPQVPPRQANTSPWVQYTNEQGVPYYVNTQTNESRWNKPY